MDTDLLIVGESLGVVEVRDAAGNLITVLEPTADVIQIVTPELMGPPGPQGMQGATGIIGPRGHMGPVGPFAPTFRMEFASAADTWVINHNLGVYPTVDLYEFDGSKIGGDIAMPDKNTVVVTYDFPVAGFAILKA